jgi:hypothetical protein
VTTIRGKNPVGWKRPFDDPIDLSHRRQLVTLQAATDYILRLPKAEQKLEEWQTATEALILAAEGRGPVMHARIGVLPYCERSTATKCAYSSPTAKPCIGGSGS